MNVPASVSKRKFPKTHHVPWSLGIQSDDKVFPNMRHLEGKMIVVTEKLDGENTTMSRDFIHARSLDSPSNWTRAWVTKMHSALRYDIPDNMKIVGENLFAEHAIRYPDNSLNSYFYLFSIWSDVEGSEDDYCLDYDDIVEYAELFDLPMPKVLYRGLYNEKVLMNLQKTINFELSEGYVIRTVDGFFRSDFKNCVAKFVRANHVQDDSDHWLKNAKQNGKLADKVMPAFMGSPQ